MLWLKLRIIGDRIHKYFFLFWSFWFIFFTTVGYFDSLKILVGGLNICSFSELKFRVIIRADIYIMTFVRISDFFTLLFRCLLCGILLILLLFFSSRRELILIFLTKRCPMAFAMIMDRVDLTRFDKIRVTRENILHFLLTLLHIKYNRLLLFLIHLQKMVLPFFLVYIVILFV